MVGTRLHCHDQRRAARTLACGFECDHLRVRAAGALVPTLSDDGAIGHDHRAHDGVRMSGAAAALGEVDRPLEMLVHALILGRKTRDEEAAGPVDVRQREKELGPLRMAEGRPLGSQVVDSEA